MNPNAVNAVREGRAQLDWMTVESTHGGHRAVFRVLADALRVDGVRETFSAREAQESADALGCLLPTPKLLDLRAAQAPVHTLPRPKFYPGGVGMSDRPAVLEHSARVEAAIAGLPGGASNVGKHWVLHARVTKDRAVLYGWHVLEAETTVKDGKRTWQGIALSPAVTSRGVFVIQPAAAAHDYAHHDYSMTLLLVHGDCEVDGVPMRTADVLGSAELAGLLVEGGAPLAPRLPGVPAPAGAPPPRDELPTLDLSPAEASPLLKRGASGDAVRELQRLVGATVDGSFGPGTEVAVKRFQAARGLEPDGKVGPKTWEALRATRGTSSAATPEIPFVQARNFYAGRKEAVRVLVIHTMEAGETTKTAENVAAWFASAKAPMASAHFCIDSDSIVQCVREEDTAFHAKQANAAGIGLEHAGYAAQTPEQWADVYSTAMLARSAKLAAALCKRHGIPARHLTPAELLAGEAGIVGHDDCTKAWKVAGGHGDPGRNFPWDDYCNAVRRDLEALG